MQILKRYSEDVVDVLKKDTDLRKECKVKVEVDTMDIVDAAELFLDRNFTQYQWDGLSAACNKLAPRSGRGLVPCYKTVIKRYELATRMRGAACPCTSRAPSLHLRGRVQSYGAAAAATT